MCFSRCMCADVDEDDDDEDDDDDDDEDDEDDEDDDDDDDDDADEDMAIEARKIQLDERCETQTTRRRGVQLSCSRHCSNG